MATEVLFVQVLVLGFTAALWWIARRDLAARVLPSMPPALPVDTAELEQLCATLETLVTRLSQRLEAVEARLPHLQQAARSAAPEPTAVADAAKPPSEPVSSPPVVPEPPPDARYAQVYALLASGVSDPAEIVRQTGLGRGEVDLILSLRDRRAF